MQKFYLWITDSEFSGTQKSCGILKEKIQKDNKSSTISEKTLKKSLEIIGKGDEVILVSVSDNEDMSSSESSLEETEYCSSNRFEAIYSEINWKFQRFQLSVVLPVLVKNNKQEDIAARNLYDLLF